MIISFTSKDLSFFYGDRVEANYLNPITAEPT